MVTLAGERNFLSILHSLVDVNLEDFSLVHDLPSAAVLTSGKGEKMIVRPTDTVADGKKEKQRKRKKERKKKRNKKKKEKKKRKR